MQAEPLRLAGPARIIGLAITLNESIHIERCLRSLQGLCDHVLVVDSGSSDDTADICRRLGAQVAVHPFVTHAGQVNAGLDLLDEPEGSWVLRIDADEYLDPTQHERVRVEVATAPAAVAGLELRRHIVFLGRQLRWGGLEPNPQLRLWRLGRGRSEQRWMDEHVIVEGDVRSTAIDLFDENRNSISWWTDKHNRYASREALQILIGDPHNENDAGDRGRLGRVPAIKRFIKERIYKRIPLALRAFLYFALRYVFLLGFLDGVPGLFFHFLQGCWYRLLVDAKVLEIRQQVHAGMTLSDAIRDRLGIEIAPPRR